MWLLIMSNPWFCTLTSVLSLDKVERGQEAPQSCSSTSMFSPYLALRCLAVLLGPVVSPEPPFVGSAFSCIPHPEMNGLYCFLPPQGLLLPGFGKLAGSLHSAYSRPTYSFLSTCLLPGWGQELSQVQRLHFLCIGNSLASRNRAAF